MTSHYIKPTFLKGFIVGIVLALLLMAILPVSFQPSAQGQGVNGRVAVNSGTYQISLRGIVPVVCRVSVDQQIALAGGHVTNLGTMSEFCNSPNGYVIYVDNTSDLAGAILTVDGRRIQLSANGSTAIVQSNQAARRSRRISLDLRHVPSSRGALWFRIAPL